MRQRGRCVNVLIQRLQAMYLMQRVLSTKMRCLDGDEVSPRSPRVMQGYVAQHTISNLTFELINLELL